MGGVWVGKNRCNMKKLMMDLETKSDVDIAKAGVYRYADSPYFDILLFAYSVDDAPVQVIDLASGEQLPEEILNALTDDRIQKHAFNASFERVCLSVWRGSSPAIAATKNVRGESFDSLFLRAV